MISQALATYGAVSGSMGSNFGGGGSGGGGDNNDNNNNNNTNNKGGGGGGSGRLEAGGGGGDMGDYDLAPFPPHSPGVTDGPMDVLRDFEDDVDGKRR